MCIMALVLQARRLAAVAWLAQASCLRRDGDGYFIARCCSSFGAAQRAAAPPVFIGGSSSVMREL